MKYTHKENGTVVTVISEDKKCKTVTVQYEDGKTRVFSTATMQRWWRKVADEEVESNLVPMPGIEKLEELKKEVTHNELVQTVKEMPADKVVEMVDNTLKKAKAKQVIEELTDEQYAQIGKEIAEQAKQKAELAKAKKRTVEKPIDVATKLCKKFFKNCTTAQNNVGVYATKSDKSRLIDVWGRKDTVRIYVSEDNEAFKSIPKNLYEVKGFGSGKLNKSIYVTVDNIETVLSYFLNKEGK